MDDLMAALQTLAYDGGAVAALLLLLGAVAAAVLKAVWSRAEDFLKDLVGRVGAPLALFAVALALLVRGGWVFSAALAGLLIALLVAAGGRGGRLPLKGAATLGGVAAQLLVLGAVFVLEWSAERRRAAQEEAESRVYVVLSFERGNNQATGSLVPLWQTYVRAFGEAFQQVEGVEVRPVEFGEDAFGRLTRDQRLESQIVSELARLRPAPDVVLSTLVVDEADAVRMVSTLEGLDRGAFVGLPAALEPLQVERCRTPGKICVQGTADEVWHLALSTVLAFAVARQDGRRLVPEESLDPVLRRILQAYADRLDPRHELHADVQAALALERVGPATVDSLLMRHAARRDDDEGDGDRRRTTLAKALGVGS